MLADSLMYNATNSKRVILLLLVAYLLSFLSCGPVDLDVPPEPIRESKTDPQEKNSNTTSEKNLTCDEEDQKQFRNNSAFTERWHQCGRSNWGDRQGTINCLRGHFQMRSVCGACFGDFTACGKANCKWPCLRNSRSESCKQCGQRYCGGDWERCTGLKLSIIAD